MRKYKSRLSIKGKNVEATGISGELICVFKLSEDSKKEIFTSEKGFYLWMTGITNPNPEYRVNRDKSTVGILEYILDGEGYIEIDNKIYHVKKGDAYYLPYGSRHTYYADKINPFKKMFVSFICPKFNDFLKILGLDNQIVFTNCNIKPDLETLFKLEDISEVSEVVSKNALGIILSTFLKISENAKEMPSYKQDLALKVKILLDNGVYTIKSLKEICVELNVNKSHIVTSFKNAFGRTPYKYLLDLRMKHARELLLNPSYSINDISNILCFYDSYTFSKAFKGKTGYSPSEYRRLNNIH